MQIPLLHVQVGKKSRASRALRCSVTPLLFLLPLLRAAFRNHEMGDRNGGSRAIGVQSAVFQSPPTKAAKKQSNVSLFRSFLSAVPSLFLRRSSRSMSAEKTSLLSVFLLLSVEGEATSSENGGSLLSLGSRVWQTERSVAAQWRERGALLGPAARGATLPVIMRQDNRGRHSEAKIYPSS